MSTIVQMPVRVKPPPADTGEIISPGCASFEIAMPSNGARTTMSARSVLRALTWLSATWTCCCAIAIRALSDSTSAWAASSSARPTTCPSPAAARRSSVSSASLQPGLVLGGAALRARRAAPRRRSSRPRSCESSRRASTWPASTACLPRRRPRHLAGDLRRHRGPAPRRHVARGVEHRRPSAGPAAPPDAARSSPSPLSAATSTIHPRPPRQQDERRRPDARPAAAAGAAVVDQCAATRVRLSEFVATE